MKSIKKAVVTQYNEVIKAYKRHFDPKFLKAECERCMRARTQVYEYLEQIDYNAQHGEFKKANEWIKKLDKYFTDWGCHDLPPWNKIATGKRSRNRKSSMVKKRKKRTGKKLKKSKVKKSKVKRTRTTRNIKL